MKRGGQNFNERTHSSVCPFVHAARTYTGAILPGTETLRHRFSLRVFRDLIRLSLTPGGRLSAFVPLSPLSFLALCGLLFPSFSASLSSSQRRAPRTNQMTGQPESTLSLLEKPDRPNVDLCTSPSSKTALKIKLAISPGRPGQIMYYCKHGAPKHLTF